MGSATQPFNSFYNWVNKESLGGHNLEGNRKPYLRYEALRLYWTTSRIAQLLHAALDGGALNYSAENIRESYLIPFSVLVYMSWSKQSYLSELATFTNFKIQDHSFPQRKKHKKIRYEIWPDFDRLQWQFCPIKLGFRVCADLDLDSRSIFPGVPQNVPSSSEQSVIPPVLFGEATFKPVKISAEEAKTLPGLTDGNAIIKSYSKQDHESYKSEFRAYNKLQTDSRNNPNILRCYGAFYYQSRVEQTEVYNLVLKQADGGSLEHFYQKVQPPKTKEQICCFWSSLIMFLRGLAKLHNDNAPNTEVVCVHQDLKPSNILISQETENPYEFVPKLCDFGLSSTSVNGVGWYNDGTSTFSPPELHLSPHVRCEAKPEYDRWAAACILVDAAVWVKDGVRGQELFAQQRRNENHSMAPKNAGLGRSDCFHDNNGVLGCVRQIEELLRRDQFDLSADVVKFAVSQVLDKVVPRERSKASELLPKLEKAISSSKFPNQAISIVASDHRQGQHRDDRPRALPLNTNCLSHSEQPSPVYYERSLNYFIGEESSTSALALGEMSLTDRQTPRQGSRSPQSVPLPSSWASPEAPNRSILRPNNGFPWSTESIMTCSTSNEHEIRQTHQPAPIKYSPLGFQGRGASQYPDNLSSQTTERLSPLTTTETGFPRASTPTSLPHITIDQAESYRFRKKKHGTAYLAGEETAFPKLSGRDHIFVVDNSRSMEGHIDEVLKWFTELAYLLKEADGDGIEVILTSDGKTKCARHTAELVDYLKLRFRRGFSEDTCNMEWCLGTLIENIIKRLPGDTPTKKRRSLLNFSKQKADKPISIYVFTNGLWTKSLENGHEVLKSPIGKLVKAIDDRLLTRSQVVLQFLRFGDDQEAIRRLSDLDDFLPLVQDNVDHKSTHDGVWHVLTGSLDQRNDAFQRTQANGLII